MVDGGFERSTDVQVAGIEVAPFGASLVLSRPVVVGLIMQAVYTQAALAILLIII